MMIIGEAECTLLHLSSRAGLDEKSRTGWSPGLAYGKPSKIETTKTNVEMSVEDASR